MNLVSTSTGVKNIGTFLEALARINPHLMSQHFAALKEQIDSPAHQIRSSLMGAMGLVVAYIHREVEALNNNNNNNNNSNADPSTNQPTDSAVDTSVDGPAAVAASSDNDMDNNDNDADSVTDATSPNPRADTGSMNAAQLTRIRDAFLDLLVERTHDVSPWTRANVLKVWVALLESQSVPVRVVNRVAELAVDRLHDKVGHNPPIPHAHP